MIPGPLSRRAFLSLPGLAAARAAAAPARTVALARCREYDAQVLPALARMFDQLGGLAGLVRNKTVAIKLNLGGPANARLRHRPAELSNWVHPRVIGAVLHLMDAAGARRIRLLEGARYTSDPLAEHMLEAGWEPEDLLRAARRVELVATNTAGAAKRYEKFPVPDPLIYPAFLLHPAYAECDVFVSLAKLKEHVTTGITLSLKNCFGITPTSIYGDSAGEAEPEENPQGGRGAIFHLGRRQPSSCAPSELDPRAPRSAGWRVPRIVVDIAAARPIHLSIIDGIHSMAGGEGVARPDARPASAGVLIASLNPVNADAAAAAVMGFDPRAPRGTAPFERCDSTLLLAQQRGLGSADVSSLEIAGAPIRELLYPFRQVPKR